MSQNSSDNLGGRSNVGPANRQPSVSNGERRVPSAPSEAVVFSGDPETGECSMDVFRGDDPVRKAEALRESCRADFPTRVWAIAMNDAAREEMGARRMREWGLTDA